MAPFYGWGSTASRLEPLRGGSLLFTTKFPEIPGTHFVNLRVNHGANHEHRTPGLAIQHLNHFSRFKIPTFFDIKSAPTF